MRLTFAHPYNSIESAVSDDEIPDFIVLSGPNGSGKTNLLEAIQAGASAIEGVPIGRVRLFTLAQLVLTAEGPQSASTYRNRWLPLQQVVQDYVTQMTTQPNSMVLGSDELEEEVRARVKQSRLLTPEAFQRMFDDSSKRLIDFTGDDFRRYAPLIVGIRDPFSLTVNELFLTYHQRRERNEIDQWREETKRTKEQVALTDGDFIARFGPAPWDLLNETLSVVGLDYYFEPPKGSEEDLVYEAFLIHNDTGGLIRTSELSSGERTLMAIAMGLYTGTRLGEAIELPQALLLDEVDAVLHPSMVQSLLRVVDDIFCQRYGVKVILTTHAPSTVALAPEKSVFTMRRSGHPRVRSASRDQALASLLVGIPTLSVRNENRRQVFVESEYDQACYQELFLLLRPRLKTPFSLEFIASGKGGQGNADAVKHLVTSLRASGNAVQGILDRDQRSDAPDGIVFVAARRALENLILDPLAVGLFLLREQIANPKAMGAAGLRHFELQPQHAQGVCDYVVAGVGRPDDEGASVTLSYIGGFSVAAPRFYVDIDGHDLEDRLGSAFPQLKKYGSGLKLSVIQRALADLPDFIPKDVLDLLQRLTT